jgi:hypothetical protein
VKIIFLSVSDSGPETQIRCVAGAGAPPPGFIDGPLRYKKFLSARERDELKRTASGPEGDFDPAAFDIDACNRRLSARLLTTNG